MSYRVHLENLIRVGRAGYRLFLFRENLDGSGEVYHSVTVSHLQQHAAVEYSQVLFSDEFPGVDVKAFLQAMSDAAWEIGIKPKQLENNSNELKATKYHLEDMRRLAGVNR